MSKKVTILFLASNPKDSSKLRLDEEIREIYSKIRAAEFRDSFDLVSRWAIRPLDLLQAFNEVKPDIVHFSGHGSQNAELILEDDDGNAKQVSEAALVSLFKNAKDNIRLVLFNACHSDVQAVSVSQQIECTIGMNVAISDAAAIIFASTFYGALAFGRSVGQAFEQGRTALMLEGILEESTPVLLTRPGTDALTVTFVNRKPVNPVLPTIALDILMAAVVNNTAINLVRYDGGVAVRVGVKEFDCQSNLEQAALLEHAVSMLVHVGWLNPTNREMFHVTHSGYEAAKKLRVSESPRFLRLKEQMPTLIAEMKKDLETKDGKFVREFFIMSRRHVLGGSEKPRFIYYEEDHDNLRGMIDILENHNYVVDVTPKNAPIYRMSEDFVDQVLKHG